MPGWKIFLFASEIKALEHPEASKALDSRGDEYLTYLIPRPQHFRMKLRPDTY
jgi:hypothetical protein